MKRVIKKTLIIFAPLWLLFSIIIFTLYFVEKKRNTVMYINKNMNTVSVIKKSVQKEISTVISDVLFLSDSFEPSQCDESAVCEKHAMLLSSFSKRRGNYDQIRILNNKGYEIFRVNNEKGIPVIIPKNELQDKSGRDYFKNSLNLKQKEIYISRLDLNIENGKIEVPHKPMIRFCTPIFNKDGSLKWIIVINYFGNQILKYFDQFIDNSKEEKLMLVNAEGYWLKSSISEDEWGFVIDSRKEKKFSNTYFEEWKKITEFKHGNFKSKNGLFTFMRIYPNKNSAFDLAEKDSFNYFWQIILYISENDLTAKPKMFIKNLLYVYIPLIILSLLGAFIFSIINEKRIKNKQLIEMQSIAYSRFVPKKLLQLFDKENITEVKTADCKNLEMTVLFSDIRSYTTISESLTPRGVFDLLNNYFYITNPIIEKNEGIIDKYIGDAIMALFSRAPDDALKSAIEIKKSLRKFNEIRRQKNEVPVITGIGIHYGEVELGTVGDNSRLQATVIGDAVNLAARLESATKLYGIDLLISDTIYSKLHNPEDFNLRMIDTVRVKGKETPIILYEVYDIDEPEIIDCKKKIKDLFASALDLYKKGDFKNAMEFFKQCLEICPKDTVSPTYIKRCTTLLRIPPGNDWAGISTL